MIRPLPPETRIGKVSLGVQNLAQSILFYQQSLGFQLHNLAGKSAELGAGREALLSLIEKPDAHTISGTTGLYHFAILVPSRLALAHSLNRLAASETPLQGFADHLVSEAVYLADPDGNGIEIYRDRPRSEWPRKNGQLIMSTDPLDLDGIMGELDFLQDIWAGLSPDTHIGHIHLRVADLLAAESFYTQGIGFDLVMRFGPAAGFVSAGGYHHHIGFNTWNSRGAPPPPPSALGLNYFEIVLPGIGELETVLERLAERKIEIQNRTDGTIVQDPSGNKILLCVRDTAN